MPPSTTPKKPAPAAAPAPKTSAPVPAGPPADPLDAENAAYLAAKVARVDPDRRRPCADLAELTERINATTAAEKAAHVATYRRAVAAIAAGNAPAPEEEQPLAAALAALELSTDDLGRDVATVRTVVGLKQNLGATAEERTARSDQLAQKTKASAANLDRLREALKRAEATHNETYGQELGYAHASGELERLVAVNPRLWAPAWPTPKPTAPDFITSNPLPMAPPTPPPPPVTEVYHPWLAKVVPITPEKYAELSGMAPSPNTPLHQQTAVDRLVKERAEATADAETARRMRDLAESDRALKEKRAALDDKPAAAEAPAG